jgi:hypothetical protein
MDPQRLTGARRQRRLPTGLQCRGRSSGAPTAITARASEVDPDSATLDATISPNEPDTFYGSEYASEAYYDPDAPNPYGSRAPARSGSVATADGSHLVSATLDGLEPASTCDFRVLASNAEGTTEGEDLTFTTPAAPQPPNAAPAIKGLGPGAKVRDRTPTIRTEITDAGTNPSRDGVRLFVDGRPVKSFEYDAATSLLRHTTGRLGFGGHTVLVLARDAEGLSTESSSAFKVTR